MQRFCDIASEEQLLVYGFVLQLKREGFGYKRIMKKILNEKQVMLSLSTLSYWFNNNVRMLGGENSFRAEPSPELAYVLGTMFGDGCITRNKPKQEYCVRLDVVDKDFAEKFSSCVSKLLCKEKDYAPCKNKRGHYSIQVRSKQLYNFIKSLKDDFEKAKPFIEKYPAEFIQGLADSEGCPGIFSVKKLGCVIVVAYSTNYPLLQYVKNLLKNNFGIDSVLLLQGKAGASDSVIGGRLITRTKNVYGLRINKSKHVRIFFGRINFSIKRKREKLADVLKILEFYGSEAGADIWKQNYVKGWRGWMKITDYVADRPNRESNPGPSLDRAIS